jgi:hypothetical protein
MTAKRIIATVLIALGLTAAGTAVAASGTSVPVAASDTWYHM